MSPDFIASMSSEWHLKEAARLSSDAYDARCRQEYGLRDELIGQAVKHRAAFDLLDRQEQEMAS